MKELERTMKALANRRRLAILKFLKYQKRGAKVGDIAEEIGLSFTSTSKHLRILANAGLIDREQVRLEMWYGLAAAVPPGGSRIIALL